MKKLQAAGAAAFELLRSRGEKVSFAESLTGGMIAATFVENPGASYALDESYVTYAAESKARILGVSWDTIDTVGVVSAACACEMAAGVKRISGAHWGVSATGLAGPDGGTAEKPVGTVFVGVSGKNGIIVHGMQLSGSRMEIRRQAADCALKALAGAMEENK